MGGYFKRGCETFGRRILALDREKMRIGREKGWSKGLMNPKRK